MDYKAEAENRIKKENVPMKGQKKNAMRDAVAKALLGFAEQDEEFAQAIAQGKPFADCMAFVAKDVGNSISDLDAYKKAAQFYFPGCQVRMVMEIDVCPNRVQTEVPERRESKLLRLEDFL